MPNGNKNALITSLPFPEDLYKDALRFDIRKHTKFIRILSGVEKVFRKPDVRRLVFHGTGDECEKCISCVEILKKTIKAQLFQWNFIKSSCNMNIDNRISDEDRMKNLLPEIFVLISRDPYPKEYSSLSQQMRNQMLPAVLDRLDYSSKNEKKHQRKRVAQDESEYIWRRPSKVAKKEKAKIVT